MAGTKTVTVTVTDAYGAKVSKNVNIGVTVAALTWGTAATLPAATRGTPYALRIWSRDGTPAYAFSVTKSSFAGLAMTLNAGTTIPTSAMWLKGTPTTAGTYSFTAYITDGKGAKVSRTFTIVVK